MSQKGLIHIYTGNGKGKTTTSVGLAVRALGHGFRVCYASFHKRPEVYGYTEIKNLEKLGATVYAFAKGSPLFTKDVDLDMLKQQVIEGFGFLKELMQRESFDMLIMDEILISVGEGFLPEEELIQFLKDKPENLEVVMTGRGATENVIAVADYVSNITKVKHPYDNNIPSREGIEF